MHFQEKNLEELLQGDWVACGHEIKKNAVPVKCVQSNTASFESESLDSIIIRVIKSIVIKISII